MKQQRTGQQGGLHAASVQSRQSRRSTGIKPLRDPAPRPFATLRWTWEVLACCSAAKCGAVPPTGWGGNPWDADLPTALELRNASCVRIWWRSLRALRAACVGRLYTPTRPPAPAPVPPSPRSTYTRPGPRATTQGLVDIRADGAWARGPIPRVPRCSGLERTTV